MQLDRVLIIIALAAAMFMSGCATGGGSRSSSTSQNPTPSNPDDPKTKAATLYTDLGQKYMAQGKLEIALENLNKALAADPKHADAHTVIGLLYERIQNNAKAEEHYRRAVQLRPKSGNENNNYGAFLCKSVATRGNFLFRDGRLGSFYQTPAVALTNAGSAIKGGKLVRRKGISALHDRGRTTRRAVPDGVRAILKNEFFKARASSSVKSRSPNKCGIDVLGRNID